MSLSHQHPPNVLANIGFTIGVAGIAALGVGGYCETREHQEGNAWKQGPLVHNVAFLRYGLKWPMMIAPVAA